LQKSIIKIYSFQYSDQPLPFGFDRIQPFLKGSFDQIKKKIKQDSEINWYLLPLEFPSIL
jgi:hypothetical protein